MNKTKIEWVKNPDGTLGYTWNPLTGCLNGCPYCYARRLANGRLKQRYLANLNISYEDLCPNPDLGGLHSLRHSEDPFYPRFWKERLDDLVVHPKKRRGIFVCDMGELFGDWIPREWQDRIFSVIRAHPQHRFYLLTKQPQNLIKWSPFPENCWVGVTATNADMAFDAINHLDDVQANVHFLSFEPLLAPINLVQLDVHLKETINWLIIGACTGSWCDIVGMSAKYPALGAMPYGKKWTLQPKIEWVEEIVRAADKAGIPVFLKNNLKPLFSIPEDEAQIHPEFGKERYKIPEWAYAKRGTDNWLRQEMPKVG